MGEAYHEGSSILWNCTKSRVRTAAAMMMTIVVKRKTTFIAYFCPIGRLRRRVMAQGKRMA